MLPQTIEKELFVQLTAARTEESKRQEERVRQEFEHSSRQRIKQEEKQKIADAAETEKREKQLLAVQKDRQLQELREKWVTTSTETVNMGTAGTGASKTRQNQGGGKRKKKGGKSEDGDADGGGVFEEGDGFDRVDRSTYQGEIDFGSSSDERSDDEEPAVFSTESQLGIDIFGVDEEDGRGVTNKRKNPEGEGHNSSDEDVPQQLQPKRLKKRSIAADDDDDALLNDPELLEGDLITGNNSMMIASDSEDNI